MTQVPTLATINAAELRLVQSRRNVLLGVDRTNSALRETLARPSTLVTVAIVSVISAYLLTPRRRPTVKSEPIQADTPIKAPRRSLLRTFVSMYGARLLTLALQLHAAAGKNAGPGVNANPPDTSTTGATAST